jgi:uncharacterized damage-inducible protein DinB
MRLKVLAGVLAAEDMPDILQCHLMDMTYFQTMARYNRWMNGKIYEICAQMSDEERKLDRGAPFKSIHGVLNHLLLCDRAWLGRFTKQPFAATGLDQELFSDFGELRRERAMTDDAIDAWLTTLTPEVLSGNLTFTPMSIPVERTVPMTKTLQHFFNHQTHHRGQITAMIEQAGYDCGVTDLLQMPETGK